ncbi:MAG: PSP1 protein [uncultured bacterium]|nr:MAG: PSP1 protein [uncultured bacterium]
MKVVGVQLYPWDQVYDFDLGKLELARGDHVVVKTNAGVELGTVVYVGKEIDEETVSERPSSVLRKMTQVDEDKIKKYDSKRREVLQACHKFIDEHELQMKLVDAYFSFDGSRIIFTFTAESRVDFRNLVKDLTRKFQKSIRLQQIGSRDEVKNKGGFGMCGRELCCVKFLDEFTSITTDMARVQQMTHRGSERISGVCGRLMCCLAYEEEQYKEWMKKMPELGTLIKTEKGEGKVIDRNLPRQTVRIVLDDKDATQMEVPLDEING